MNDKQQRASSTTSSNSTTPSKQQPLSEYEQLDNAAELRTTLLRVQAESELLREELRMLRGSARFRLATAIAESRTGLSGVVNLFRVAAGLACERLGARSPRLARVLRCRSHQALRMFALPPKVPQPSRPPRIPKKKLFSLDATALCEVRVAAVLDPFSLASFSSDCRLLALQPAGWLAQLQGFRPHLLLVESAWVGADGEWANLVAGAESEPLSSLVDACRERGIPTVFWNKEDPLHFEAFLKAARLFDWVFTTDAASVGRYKRELGHDQVGVLPFALQPKTHNPIGDELRLPSAVFAGAWYGRFPRRCRDFENVADAMTRAGRLVIHDRNGGDGAEHQVFPEKYVPMLAAKVPHDQIASVFRRHVIGVNINTVRHSPTMFARRVFELIGCNTSVFGNWSLGCSTLLGDLIIASDESGRLEKQAKEELSEPSGYPHRHKRLMALRKVLQEHTYINRLSAIVYHVTGRELPPKPESEVYVFARASDELELSRVLANYQRQTGIQATLAVDVPGTIKLPPDLVRVQDCTPSATDWIALMHPDDFYGEHYLLDLMLARNFGIGRAYGKGSWFHANAGALSHLNPEHEYRVVRTVALRRSLWRSDCWEGSPLRALDMIDEGAIHGDGLISVDALSYVEFGGGSSWSELEEPRLSPGASMEALEQFVSAVPAAANAGLLGSDAFDGAQLARLFQLGNIPPGVSIGAQEHRFEVCSVIAPGEDAWAFSAAFAPAAIERDGRVALTLQAPASSQLKLHLESLDTEGRPLFRRLLPRWATTELPIESGVAGYRFAMCCSGPFVRQVEGVWMRRPAAQPLILPGRSRVLLLCNGYPSPQGLYKNAFVHRRVLEYRSRGIEVDVVWVSDTEEPRSYEYQGVPVVIASTSTIEATVRHSAHVSIAIHFLDPALWAAVSEVAERRRVVVWIHGAEIQPSHRRHFNYLTDSERALADEQSKLRMELWRGLLATPPSGLHLVFVSRTFAEQVWEDLGFRLAEDRWSVIHNPIDTVLFSYKPKQEEDRFRVLSVRPHASRVYANDLVAGAIRHLSKRTWFNRMRFTLVGDGPRWAEDFAGLSAFGNVAFERRFLSQDEVATLHKLHGIFLVPTRADTQGVSRDEAMSSGLVPVTCSVGAVPEFVSESCGMMCQPDDAEALAEAIARLVEDPALFRSLSARAAARVREQSSAEKTIPLELRALGLYQRLTPERSN